ncbi:MAG TPA: hypothetical protein VLA13_00345, partial [Massilibacterium sp.]|nr:hypothetical protein [Massilibacterium sp.]
MGRSVRRIITNQAELDNAGNLKWKMDEAGAYDNAAQREKDAAILSDQRGQRIVDAVREMYDDVGKQAIDTYQGAIDELQRVDLVGEPATMFRNFYDSELSIKQWQKNVAKSEENGEELLALYNKHKGYKPLQEAIQFREIQLRIQSLQGRYVPQIQSMSKITEAKNRFLQREGLTNASSQVKEDAWGNELQRRITLRNKEGFETLSTVSASGDNIDTIYASSFNKMLKELRNVHAPKIQNSEIRRQVLRDLDSGQPDIIEQYIGRTEMGGTPRYYVKNPDKFETNILADMNSETKSSAARTYINTVMMKQSNHLDNPRNYILPDDFLNNDLNNIFSQYARDVGVKLHLVENGMGTQRQLNKKIDGVISELRQKGVTDNLEGKRRRIEEWYAAISNTRDAINVTKTDSEAAHLYNVERKNNKLVRTIMNFGAMPFMWFTPFYSPFTPFILGPFQSSFRNIARTYREVLKNPQALKSATDELYKTGVIEKKLHSMSAFMQDGYSKDALSGTDGSVVDWLYNISQKGINFSTRMSLTKFPLSKMGIDVENTGLLRLFTGNLYDISGAESGLVTMAVMREIEDMVEAG